MKNRLDYIDLLKGFAIFLMVMAHILIGVNSKDQTVSRVIYTFHMPLFMFMSGYVFDLNRRDLFDARNFIGTMRKRTVSLILPGVIWMALRYILSENELVFPWFLRTLFEIIVVVYLTMWITKRLKFNAVGDAIALVVLYGILYCFKHFIEGTKTDEILNMARLQIFYPYFAFGYLFRRYFWERVMANTFVFPFSIIIFVACVYVGAKENLPHGLEVIVRYSSAVSGILISYFVARSIECKNTIAKFVKYMGLYSLNIYLLSEFLQPCPQWVGTLIQASTINGEIFHKTSVFIQLLAGGFLTTYTIVACLAITKVCEKSDFLNKLLFGR